jgi:hypothetical protein
MSLEDDQGMHAVTRGCGRRQPPLIRILIMLGLTAPGEIAKDGPLTGLKMMIAVTVLFLLSSLRKFNEMETK